MIKLRKFLVVSIALCAILTLGATALLADSPRDLDKQQRAATQASQKPVATSTQQVHPDVAAKLQMEAEIQAKLQADETNQPEDGSQPDPVKPARVTNKAHQSGPSAIRGRAINYDKRLIYLLEDFETEVFPPTDWAQINTDPGYGWFLGTFSGGGTQAALVTWHAPGYVQDEWLITPQINASGASSLLRLEFEMLKGYDYPHDFKVHISFDGTNFTEVWDSYSVPYPAHEWYGVTVDLSAYAGGQNFYLGFQYYGEDADLFGLDNVVVTDDAPPVGRCCYGDPTNPSCDDVLQSECSALGGSWTAGVNCTDNPCPISGPNDNCADVTPEALPYTFTGNNEGATFDTECQYFTDYPNVWIAFTIDECSDVTVSYCGSPAGWGNGWLNMVTDCGCGTLVSYTSYDFDCANGNPNIVFERLEPGTYYYPVMLDPESGAAGNYSIEVTATKCPDAPANDDCANAEAVGDVTNLAFSTAAASWDGGGTYIVSPNIWYCYTATCDGLVTVSLCGSLYDTRLAVYDGCVCGPLGAVIATDDDACDPGLQSVVSFQADAGDQFMIEVGGYSSNSGDGVLTISCSDAPAVPGDNCANPIKIDIPGLPFVDNAQYTCGRLNDYSNTCLGSYDGGEDIIYEITVATDATVNIDLDPLGTTYTGMLLSTDCPPTNCIGYVTGSSGTTHKRLTCVDLAPGVYYLMIDTWPSPACIPSFNLTITDTVCVATENDNCADAIPVGEVADLAWSTVGTSHDGPTGCMSSPNIWYAYKPGGEGDATISLCGSSFDTKLAVYTGTCGALTQIACNDDACGVQSEIELSAVDPNLTYYIEVGGYSANVGDGILNITLTGGCEYTCTSGTPEGETCIEDYGSDVTNGGCNEVTPVFGAIACGETVCGTFSTYTPDGTANYRDTDWYLFTLESWSTVTLSGNANFPYLIGFLEETVPGIATCDNLTGYLSPYATSDECVPSSITATLPPGDYIVFVSGQAYSGYPCLAGPWEYGITLTCVPAEPQACAASGGCDEFIEQVIIGTIDNTSACDGYANYTSLSTNVEVGGSYPITIVVGDGYSSDRGGLWVDWNDDLVFDVAEEVVLDVSTGVGPYTGTVVVPSNAVEGNVLMRVRVTYNTTPTPCGADTYGEVEDYTLTVGTPGPVFTHAYSPNPILVLEKFSVGQNWGHLYLSDAALASGDAADMENVEVKIDGCPVPLNGTSVITGGFGELTGDVLDVQFDLKQYVLCAEIQNGGLIWGYVDSFFDVFYEIDGVPGQIDDLKAVVRGHVPGDLNRDFAVNVADLTYMVNFLFRGGTAPLDMANANIDGSVSTQPNVADLTYLVNFLFKAGPALQHP